jgi:hypothetical protein
MKTKSLLLAAALTFTATSTAHAADPATQAHRAAIGSATAGLGAFALGTVSEASMNNALLSTVTGAGEVLVLAPVVPLAARKARRAREATGVAGAPGMRLAGLVTYGAWATHSALLFSWGIVVTPGNTYIPAGQVQVNSAMALMSGTMIAGDAMATSKQIRAAQGPASASAGTSPRAAAISTAPTTNTTTATRSIRSSLRLSPTRSADGWGVTLSGGF